MTDLTVLGVGGSIGRQTLDVWEQLNQLSPGSVRVKAISGGSDWRALAAAARRCRPDFVAISDEGAFAPLRDELADLPLTVKAGAEAVEQAAAWPEADLAVAAISGLACLAPLAAAIKSGKTIALANKEALVASGELMTGLAAEMGVELRPVDSEHSALWQCLRGEDKASVSRLILTASGGPFRLQPRELQSVTPAQALAHPSWSMGPKITVDSADMVNKGLEIIEAHWLFGVDYDHIGVLVHPQSIIHSLVEYADNSQKALLSVADMRLPIQYAVTGECRMPSQLKPLDLAKLGHLDFYEPDTERFPALELFRRAGQQGGLLPAYLNGGNEALVALFLAGRISFPCIWQTLQKMAETGYEGCARELEQVYAADRRGRQDAQRLAMAEKK